MPEAERTIPDARHEETDVSEHFVWGAAALLVACLALVVFVILWIYPHALLDRTIPSPLPVYPEPRLQTSPRADMQTFYAEEMRRLNSVGWVDKAHGVVHIPIAEAMSKVAQEGIPGWPASSGKPP